MMTKTASMVLDGAMIKTAGPRLDKMLPAVKSFFTGAASTGGAALRGTGRMLTGTSVAKPLLKPFAGKTVGGKIMTGVGNTGRLLKGGWDAASLKGTFKTMKNSQNKALSMTGDLALKARMIGAGTGAYKAVDGYNEFTKEMQPLTDKAQAFEQKLRENGMSEAADRLGSIDTPAGLASSYFRGLTGNKIPFLNTDDRGQKILDEAVHRVGTPIIKQHIGINDFDNNPISSTIAATNPLTWVAGSNAGEPMAIKDRVKSVASDMKGYRPDGPGTPTAMELWKTGPEKIYTEGVDKLNQAKQYATNISSTWTPALPTAASGLMQMATMMGGNAPARSIANSNIPENFSDRALKKINDRKSQQEMLRQMNQGLKNSLRQGYPQPYPTV